MIIFSRYGEYERRSFIEECFEKYVDVMSKTKLAGELAISSGNNNKPYFKDYPNIRFSMSHSADLVVLAMADTEVGIDIEFNKPRDYENVVERHFFEGEKKEIVDLSTFYKFWTRKEAFLKFTSEGLSGLSKADVSLELVFNGDKLVFTTLDIFEGYIGSVVAKEQPIIYVKLD
ncbi:MAG: 4'-phosphopantetheinyl transferase superfamily protein [Clostridia bacterium]